MKSGFWLNSAVSWIWTGSINSSVCSGSNLRFKRHTWSLAADSLPQPARSTENLLSLSSPTPLSFDSQTEQRTTATPWHFRDFNLSTLKHNFTCVTREKVHLALGAIFNTLRNTKEGYGSKTINCQWPTKGLLTCPTNRVPLSVSVQLASAEEHQPRATAAASRVWKNPPEPGLFMSSTIALSASRRCWAWDLSCITSLPVFGSKTMTSLLFGCSMWSVTFVLWLMLDFRISQAVVFVDLAQSRAWFVISLWVSRIHFLGNIMFRECRPEVYKPEVKLDKRRPRADVIITVRRLFEQSLWTWQFWCRRGITTFRNKEESESKR